MLFKKSMFCNVRRLHSRLCFQSHLNLVIFLVVSTILLIIIYKVVYNISDDKKYKWLERNRNISHFLKKGYGNPPMKCTYNTEVLVAVISAASHTSPRKAIRDLWKKNLPPTWALFFFVGQSQNGESQDINEQERRLFEDMVILDIEDSYLNLTIKVSLVFEWINYHCKQTKLILKTDDDVYLNLVTLRQLTTCLIFTLENMYSSVTLPSCNRWPTQDIVGHYINSKSKNYISYVAAGYMYTNIKPERNRISKWYTSQLLYSEEVFPNFLSGTSYLLTTNLIPLILEQVNNIPLISLEDVYFTGLIMNRSLNLKLSHVDGWNNFRPRWDDACLYKTLLTAHGMNPREMRTMVNAVNDTKNCDSTIRRFFTRFNEFVSSYFAKYT